MRMYIHLSVSLSLYIFVRIVRLFYRTLLRKKPSDRIKEDRWEMRINEIRRAYNAFKFFLATSGRDPCDDDEDD